MQRIEHEIPLKCEIVFMGDTHGGSYLTHYSGIKKIINFINKRENCFWMHGGDWIEAICTDDGRYYEDSNKEPIPLKQAQEIIEIFRPIAGKGIVGLLGNHELKLHRVGNFAEYICKNIGIPYGTSESRIIFTNNKKRLFAAFCTHRIGAIRSGSKDYEQQQGNMYASLKKKLQDRVGDCAVMIAHHAHQLIIVPPAPKLYLIDTPDGLQQNYLQGDMGNGDYIDPNRRWYGCAGSFLKRYHDGCDYSYSEIYDPNELGCLIMEVDEGKVKNIRKFIV